MTLTCWYHDRINHGDFLAVAYYRHECRACGAIEIVAACTSCSRNIDSTIKRKGWSTWDPICDCGARNSKREKVGDA